MFYSFINDNKSFDSLSAMVTSEGEKELATFSAVFASFSRLQAKAIVIAAMIAWCLF